MKRIYGDYNVKNTFERIAMEIKYLVLISLFLSLETGCYGISVSFCSGHTIKDYFDGSSKESALTLDGSNSAVSVLTAKYANAPTSCTCAVTSESTSLDKLHVSLKFSTRLRLTNLVSCHKRLDVLDHAGQAMHVFGCANDYIEVDDDDVEDGIRFSLNLFQNPEATDSRVVDDLFFVYIVPEPGSVLTVRCYPPMSTAASSTSSVAYSSKSSTTVSSSTTQAFVASESIDTSIVVGVAVGLGLFFLVFISCILLYIARRRSRRGDSEKPDPPTSQQQQSKYAVGRTLTNFYDKMKTNRPLPRIPASIRNITRWKRQHNAQSGVYDSIKSNNNNGKYQLDKQVSQGSDCSYLEPVTITSICEGVASKKVNDFCPNFESYPKDTQEENVHTLSVHQVSAKEISSVKDAEHSELKNTTYIHPVSNKDNLHDSGYHDDKEDSHGVYENTPAIRHTYINTVDAQKINRDSDTVAESDDPTYMDMCSRVDSIDTSADLEKQAPVNDVTNKRVLMAEDSTGYLKMSECDVEKMRGHLKPKESLFPELIKFTPHERDAKDTAEMPEVNPMTDDFKNTKNNNEQNVKKKIMKYVK